MKHYVLPFIIKHLPETRFISLVCLKNYKKMKLPGKVGIGLAVTCILVVLIFFVGFPKMIKGKIKGNLALKPNSEIRKMYSNVPFGLDFKIYIFNVTNPDEIMKGGVPVVDEVGPFVFEEWKAKGNLVDVEEEDALIFQAKDTWIFQPDKTLPLTGNEKITIPHPLILGMGVVVARDKPGMLSLINKAINAIYRNPTSVFLTAPVNDILFDGVIINCTVTDFAGKAVCTQLRASPDLIHISDDIFKFSFFGHRNGTLGKKYKVHRGIKNSRDLGRVIEYDGKKQMDVWPSKECNQYRGTDGTIFPPFLAPEEGLESFAGDLCRSLKAVYANDVKYDGIPVSRYTASLGDQSRNEDEKCYCPTPQTCMKKGVMDLTKCVGAPMVVSLPHFWDCDESYVKGVRGLHPNEHDHSIELLFERNTGSPLAAHKRLQFNLPLEPVAKIPLMKDLPTTLLPLMWVEEGVALNSSFTAPLKTFFKTIKIVNITKWVLLVTTIVGMIGCAFLHFKNSQNITVTKNVRKVESSSAEPRKSISTIGVGDYANNNTSNEIDKY